MSFWGSNSKASRERGVVLIMVIGVLAMLFIVGSTLLVVSRFERDTGKTLAEGRNLRAVGAAIIDPTIAQLREDLVGLDEEPYNEGWANGDASELSDYGDFPGYAGVNNARNGDLLLSSIEPYSQYVGTPPVNEWLLPYASWAVDAVRIQAAAPGNGDVHNVNVNLTGGPARDANGDGIRDSADSQLFAQLAGMFGGSLALELQVVPHGGMVLLDNLTHDSLLLSVIHPRDIRTSANNYSNISAGNWLTRWTALFGESGAVPTAPEAKAMEEGRLRRRFMLPPYLPAPDNGDYRTVAPALVTVLPVSLGYADPTGATRRHPDRWWQPAPGPVNHWWPFDTTVVDDPVEEARRWQAMLTPDVSPTETEYNAEDDEYDRRRLLTLYNSDDILRRQRDESRLQRLFPDFYRYIAPDPSWQSVLGQYGRVYGELLFNRPGLRTQFSLRDVLQVDWNGTQWQLNQGPLRYARARALTAYFLAMIQHTTVPGSGVDITSGIPTQEQLVQQLMTAAQLAVNTIDFADADSIPTYFEWGGSVGDPAQQITIRVVGVEKQPYITEAYAKRVKYKPLDQPVVENAEEQIYAVEIYNPYGDPNNPNDFIDLSNYEINGLPLSSAKMADGSPWTPPVIRAGEYLVFANTSVDATPNAGGSPTNYPFAPNANQVDSRLRVLASLDFSDEGSDGLVELTVNSFTNLGGGGTPPARVVVDRIGPQAHDGVNADVTLGAEPTDPVADDTRLAKHTSLQRHKEPDPYHPLRWHFTLAREKGLASAEADPVAIDPWTVHGLLDQNNNNDLHDDDDVSDSDLACAPGSGPCTNAPRFDELAPFPVLVSDAGIDPRTGGTLAFPTTGTLLLVTRYAHQVGDPGTTDDDTSVSVAATEAVLVQDPAVPGNMGSVREAQDQITMLDNGHLPVFDEEQRCLDNNPGALGNGGQAQGRLGGPWGQIVFDYFTALPLEELTHPLRLNALGFRDPDIGAPLNDDVSLLALTERQFRHVYGLSVPPPPTAGALFGGYPLVEGWDASDSSTYGLGGRVFGRINIGVAPWRVLDGLPVLADDLAALPVPELYAGRATETNARLDPPEYQVAEPVHDPAGKKFVNLLTDELTLSGGVRIPSISPTFAKYMVSYREGRPVDGLNAQHDAPAFVSVGELCEVLRRVRVEIVNTLDDEGEQTSLVGDEARTLEGLRGYMCRDPESGQNIHPFSYLGYLQLVAPLVRLQDWATVKNHVYTIYAGIRSTGEPSIDLRTQVTVDRTPCLYNPQELPVRITWTEPVGYYNALDD